MGGDVWKLLDTWRRITELFLEGLEQDVFPIPTDRTCRERYEKLAEQRKRLDANPAARSGSNEEHGEIEQLLSECVDAEAKWEQQTKESKEEKLKRKQSNEETQRNLRTNTKKRADLTLPHSRPRSTISCLLFFSHALCIHGWWTGTAWTWSTRAAVASSPRASTNTPVMQ